MPSTRAFSSALLALLVSNSAFAQTTGDPVAGKTLFDNTAGAGVPGITMSCPACHGNVENRRMQIAASSGLDGGAYADIDFDTAFTRFTQALQNVGQMQQFQALNAQQRRDVAAYLGDTPELTPENDTTLTFSVSAVNTVSAAQTITLRHATATTVNLQIVGVQVVGSEAGNFSVTPQCNGIQLTPAASCVVSLTYAPRNANNSTPDLVFTVSQGGSGNFERVLHLSGSVAVAPPPPADGGGGALGGVWLVALALATGLLARRRR